ncbi:MAG: hypothetical protein JRI68_11730 [Deltaproteobacteria bacterium]|nr:hypothetical protein [Deltaproteobacteria bacterium]
MATRAILGGSGGMLLIAALLLAACEGVTTVSATAVPNDAGATGGGWPTTSTSTSSGDGGHLQFDACCGGYGSGGYPCMDIVVDAEPHMVPADVVMVIDNSSSMVPHLDAFEQNVNVYFAQAIAVSDVDWRIILVTDHGAGAQQVCVGSPLGTGNCSGAPGEVANQFYHYDVPIADHDAACVLLDTLLGPSGGGQADQHGMYPNGWGGVLREEAVKILVVLSDDGTACSWNGNQLDDQDQVSAGQAVALSFDQLLLQQAPSHFGTSADRNYVFHAVVGMPTKQTPAEPYEAFEPVIGGTCPTAAAPGTGHQWGAVGTEGLRFPICQAAGPTYDLVFGRLAEEIVENATLPCHIRIPEPPPGETLDWNILTLLFSLGGSSPSEEFTQVPSLAACGTDDDKFYIEDGLMKLCPEACNRLKAFPGSTLSVKIPCLHW